MKKERKADLVFSGKPFYCGVCQKKNVFYVVVANGVRMEGSLCEHSDKSLLGQEVYPLDAMNFLFIEREEAKVLASEGGLEEGEGEKITKHVEDIDAARARLKKKFPEEAARFEKAEKQLIESGIIRDRLFS